MYNEHFKIYFIARFFWKIIKIVIIETLYEHIGGNLQELEATRQK